MGNQPQMPSFPDPMMGGESPEPMGSESPEPMGGESPEPMGGESPEPMGGESPEPIGGESVDATDDNGEGNDKKKEIQKLAGQLSELLHTYNEENGDDEELNKYVKGMIDAQTDGDGEDVSDDDMDMEEPEMDDEMDMEEPEMGNDMDMEEPEMDDDMDMEEPEMGKNKPQPEKKIKESKRFTKKQLMEEFGELSQNSKNREEEKLRLNKKTNLRNVNKGNPFTPPKFH